MQKNKGRDNQMYMISDGFNLEESEPFEGIVCDRDFIHHEISKSNKYVDKA
mgnify:CR=1 FL=1